MPPAVPDWPGPRPARPAREAASCSRTSPLEPEVQGLRTAAEVYLTDATSALAGIILVGPEAPARHLQALEHRRLGHSQPWLHGGGLRGPGARWSGQDVAVRWLVTGGLFSTCTSPGLRRVHLGRS